MLSIVVAMAKNRVIGKNNSLPWRLPEDIKHLREITRGKTLIMGRKTYESLPKSWHIYKFIIISRNSDLAIENAEVRQDAEALFLEYMNKPEEAFIFGGASIYKKALPFCDNLYITEVKQDFEGDTFFPEFDESIFWLKSESPIYVDEKSQLKFQYKIYSATALR